MTESYDAGILQPCLRHVAREQWSSELRIDLLHAAQLRRTLGRCGICFLLTFICPFVRPASSLRRVSWSTGGMLHDDVLLSMALLDNTMDYPPEATRSRAQPVHVPTGRNRIHCSCPHWMRPNCIHSCSTFHSVGRRLQSRPVAVGIGLREESRELYPHPEKQSECP